MYAIRFGQRTYYSESLRDVRRWINTTIRRSQHSLEEDKNILILNGKVVKTNIFSILDDGPIEETLNEFFYIVKVSGIESTAFDVARDFFNKSLKMFFIDVNMIVSLFHCYSVRKNQSWIRSISLNKVKT